MIEERDHLDYLEDILNAADKVMDFISGMTYGQREHEFSELPEKDIKGLLEKLAPAANIS